jgi:hypothetical protein
MMWPQGDFYVPKVVECAARFANFENRTHFAPAPGVRGIPALWGGSAKSSCLRDLNLPRLSGFPGLGATVRRLRYSQPPNFSGHQVVLLKPQRTVTETHFNSFRVLRSVAETNVS